ncbi:hypothetical protein NEIG_01358 [Nematocida sp. ERTm5]|nr:hypothetical protein NEIRO02_0530 [Nematocida sp. AWRm79]KAI5182970.1 hypothetical protein NEIRO03_0605 [Nematocida sp. AWRm78]OAG32435.1 hypothetical protein NEIG_01358 [Nematocida sp. ERTm5]
MHAERNKKRELLSRVVLGAVTGSVIGLTVGIISKGINRNSSISQKVTDTMIIGGTYAIMDNLVSKYNINQAYRPILSGLIAGSLGSRGNTFSIITTSVITATAAYTLENTNIIYNTNIE